MATPTVNIVVNTPATMMSPCPVNFHIGNYRTENIRTTGFSWTAGTGSEYYISAASLPGAPTAIYNGKVYEKRTGVDLNTGYRWTASSGQTGAYYLELTAGGDPGLFPKILCNTRASITPYIGGVEIVPGNDLGSMSAQTYALGRMAEDSIAFHTLYLRLTADADPDSSTITADYWKEMTEGSGVGSLNAGEYYYDSGTNRLYVRLTDSVDPDTKADRWLIADYDLSKTGVTNAQDRFDKCTVEWTVTRLEGLSGWSRRFRFCTDPRRNGRSDQVSLATKDLRGFSITPTLTQGRYTATCRIINQNGEIGTATTSTITVAANTRTKKTIKASGGDYTSVSAAITAIGSSDDIWLECENGGGETWGTAAKTISGDNWLIDVANHGLYTITGPGSGFAGLITQTGENLVVDGLSLTPGMTAAAGACFSLNGSRFTSICNIIAPGTASGNRWYRFVYFNGDDAFVNIHACTVGNTAYYSVAGQHTTNGSSDVMLSGCVFQENSGDNSIIRTAGGATRFTFLHMGSGPGTDNRIRLVSSPYAIYVHGCGAIAGGAFDVRPGANNGDHAHGELIRIDSCVMSAQEVLSQYALRRCTHANIAYAYTSSVISLASLPRLPYQNCAWICPTIAMTTDPLIGYHIHQGAYTVNEVDVTGMEWKGMLNADGGGTYSSSTQLITGRNTDQDETSWSYDQNVWIDPADKSATQIAYELASGNKYTLTQWNALTKVGTDYVHTETVNTQYVSQAGSPQQITTPAGVYYDLWGNVRSATGNAGAAIAADPGPTAEATEAAKSVLYIPTTSGVLAIGVLE